MVARRSSWFHDLPLLEGLPAALIARLAGRSERLQVPRRARLWSPGDAGDLLYWVQSGVVKVGAALDGDRELTLHLHSRNDLLGELPLLTGSAHQTFAEAWEDAAVYVTPSAEIARLLDRHAAFGRRLSSLVAHRSVVVEGRFQAVLRQPSEVRLAALLLELGDRFGVRDSRGVIINLKLTHRELASLIGTSRETVSLGLLKMRREQVIQIEGKRVVLLDPACLRIMGAEA